jgi:site-specific recombinase XerD
MAEKKMSLQELVADFYLAKQVSGKSQKTLDFYKQNLSRSLWWFSTQLVELELSQITPHTIRSLLAYVQTVPDRWQTGTRQ